MELTEILTTLSIQPLTVLGCLCIGYLIKTWEKVPNKYIPTILALFGVLFNTISLGVSLAVVINGCVCGLASTGMHQAFKQFVEKRGE